jgi:phosphoribosylaminoimidazolecarboxamide formyltransferase/IMP cyclohydrolase
VDPADYEALASELKENDGYVSLDTRFRLAKKAFDHVAHYDNAIAAYLNERARLA